jgi:hypothetical protein
MVKFWAKRIRYDLERIDEVPTKWRDDVREYIEAMQTSKAESANE